MQVVLARPHIETDSIVDGPGLRAVIWMQGCTHKCKGCHNPETHDIALGYKVNLEDILEDIDLLEEQDGITLTGGDPLFQAEASAVIAEYSKKLGLNVWCYTGFTFEEVLRKSKYDLYIKDLLDNIDVLVDGKFIDSLKTMNLLYRGSSNQRIIDVRKSLKENKTIVIDNYDTLQKEFIVKKEDVFI